MSKKDALFSYIEAVQGARWGSVLDAGSGLHSLRWLSGLNTTRWTAVTAAVRIYRKLENRLGNQFRQQDQLVLGDWSNPDLLSNESFDVVLADYLIGAVDRYSPYFQRQMVERLRTLTGRRLYLVGLEPFPAEATELGARTLLELARLRDSCYLLSGSRPYREYPLSWIWRTLEETGFRVKDVREFPCIFRQSFIDNQTAAARTALQNVADTSLVGVITARLETIRRRAHRFAALGGIRLTFDYVVTADAI